MNATARGHQSPAGAEEFAADPIPHNPVRAFRSPHLWLTSGHLICDVFVGAVTFTVVVVLLALSGSLFLVALAGVPIWMGTVQVVRGLSRFERARYRLTLGITVPVPHMPPREPFLRYALTLVRSRVVWRQIGYHVLMLPWGIVASVLTAAAWGVPLTLMALPFFYSSLPQGSADLWLLRVGDVPTAVGVGLVGAAALILLMPWVVRALSAVDAALFRSLLGSLGNEELVERVGALEISRRQVVDSADAERRRIERDLHDGAQQRLVSLAMTLGRAKSRAGDDLDEGTRALLDEAHAEAKQAITELRDLTRGLHPPVLADRGIDAALSSLAARSTVPVEVEVDIGVRPTPTVEAMAYFVVAEALTNVAKHSGARRASVVVRRVEDVLRVVVRDDGMGGADARRGSGIAGIADRIAGVDGRLSVDSPVGGPTVITVELPCAS